MTVVANQNQDSPNETRWQNGGAIALKSGNLLSGGLLARTRLTVARCFAEIKVIHRSMSLLTSRSRCSIASGDMSISRGQCSGCDVILPESLPSKVAMSCGRPTSFFRRYSLAGATVHSKDWPARINWDLRFVKLVLLPPIPLFAPFVITAPAFLPPPTLELPSSQRYFSPS